MSVLRLSAVLCRSSGEQVAELGDLRARRFVKQLNLPAQVIVTMNMENANYPSALLDQQPRLRVYRPSTDAERTADPTTVRRLVFYGSLPAEGVKEDAQLSTAILSFQDPQWVLSRRNLQSPLTYTGIDQGAILWDNIDRQNARTNGDTWIRQGATATGVLRNRTYAAGKELGALIDEMTKDDGGCDVGILPIDYFAVDGSRAMGTFNAWNQRGVDRPNVKFVYSGKLNGNVSNMIRTRGRTVTSATSVGSTGSQVYQNTSSAFGLLEEYETYSDISDQQTLLDRSVGKVANAQNAPMIVEVVGILPNAPQPLLDYDVGDTVYLTCDKGGMRFFDLPVRVHAIDIAIDQEGEIETKLTIASLPATDLGSIYVPPTDGGSTPPTGDQRIYAPSVTNGASFNSNDSSVQYLTENSQSLARSGMDMPAMQGHIEGLVVGTDYIMKVYVRGPSSISGSVGNEFYAYVGGSFGQSGSTRSANDNTHIWNATQATRETWTQLSVPFTATSSYVACGIIAHFGSPGTDPVYSAHWTIEEA